MLIKNLENIREVFKHLTVDGAYERYMEHHKRAHPHLEMLTFEDFYKEELTRKWNGRYRCC